MKKIMHLTMALAMILFFSTVAQAQVEWGLRGFENKGKSYTLFRIGYNYPISSLTQTTNNSYFDEFIGEIPGTPIDKKYTPSSTMGFTLGWSIPIARLTEVSAITADIDAIYNDMTFTPGKIAYGTGPTQNYNYEIAVKQYSLPLGVTILRGPDAIMDKSFRMSYGIGAGLAPTYTSLEFGKYDESVWKLHPYIKGEIGFFAGILFKFRGLVSFGNTSLISRDAPSYNSEVVLQQTDTQLKLGTTANLSFLIYPFSMGFAKSQWWK